MIQHINIVFCFGFSFHIQSLYHKQKLHLEYAIIYGKVIKQFLCEQIIIKIGTLCES